MLSVGEPHSLGVTSARPAKQADREAERSGSPRSQLVSDGRGTGPILIVDDEPHVREILHRWLAQEGYECQTASCANEALTLLEDGEFALLVCDIMMPGKSGLELLSVASERFPTVATIMVTGVDEREVATKALGLGAYGYIVKPFNENDVIINVVSALARRRLALQSRAYEEELEHRIGDGIVDVRRREEEIAMRLVAACEHRDEETGAHIRRIGSYAAALAEHIGWPSLAVDDIRIAAPMHDIGKIGVPDDILLKPGKLTVEEFEVVKRHTHMGADILKSTSVPILRMAKDIALSHHEWWDGSGYPQNLAGAAIPEAARIVAIADVYDALTHTRVYRSALPEAEALVTMTEGKGKHFDPQIFECFLGVLPEFRRVGQQLRDGGSSFGPGGTPASAT